MSFLRRSLGKFSPGSSFRSKRAAASASPPQSPSSSPDSPSPAAAKPSPTATEGASAPPRRGVRAAGSPPAPPPRASKSGSPTIAPPRAAVALDFGFDTNNDNDGDGGGAARRRRGPPARLRRPAAGDDLLSDNGAGKGDQDRSFESLFNTERSSGRRARRQVGAGSLAADIAERKALAKAREAADQKKGKGHAPKTQTSPLGKGRGEPSRLAGPPRASSPKASPHASPRTSSPLAAARRPSSPSPSPSKRGVGGTTGRRKPAAARASSRKGSSDPAASPARSGDSPSPRTAVSGRGRGSTAASRLRDARRHAKDAEAKALSTDGDDDGDEAELARARGAAASGRASPRSPVVGRRARARASSDAPSLEERLAAAAEIPTAGKDVTTEAGRAAFGRELSSGSKPKRGVKKGGRGSPTTASPRSSPSPRKGARAGKAKAGSKSPGKAGGKESPGRPSPSPSPSPSAAKAGVAADATLKTAPAGHTGRVLRPAVQPTKALAARPKLDRQVKSTLSERLPKGHVVVSSLEGLATVAAKAHVVLDAEQTFLARATSQEWIARHGLRANDLTLAATKWVPAAELWRQRRALEVALALYKKRLRWLTDRKTARNVFGLVTGRAVAVLIDDTLPLPRFRALAAHVERLINEQLGACERVALVGMHSTDCVVFGPVAVTPRQLDQAFAWLQLQVGERQKDKDLDRDSYTRKTENIFSGLLAGAMGGPQQREQVETYGAHVVQAVEAVAALKPDVHDLYLVLGQAPMHGVDKLERPLASLAKRAKLTINVVSWDIADQAANQQLRRLAGIGGGRFHIFNNCDGVPGDQDGVSGDDVELLAVEINSAYQALKYLVAKMANAEREEQAKAKAKKDAPPKAKEEDKPKSKRVRVGPNFEMNRSARLRIAKLDFQGYAWLNHLRGNTGKFSDDETARVLQQRQIGFSSADWKPIDDADKLLTSAEWLKLYGLEALSLTIYQVLRKIVNLSSTVRGAGLKDHIRLRWQDGTLRSLHLDVDVLVTYRKMITRAMKLYNERIRWLGTGPRRFFGNVVEEVCTLVVDTSAAMAGDLDRVNAHIQHLLQGVLVHKAHFNIVRFGRRAEKFSPDVVVADETSLQQAWDWVCQWEPDHRPPSQKKRFHKALKLAVDDLRPQTAGRHGIYVLTDGISEDASRLVALAKERLTDTATQVHSCAYNLRVGGKASEQALLDLALSSGGRFLLCLESGSEFDDQHQDSVSWALPPAEIAGLSAEDEICACTGTDLDMLRLELARAHNFFGMIDAIITSLPRAYAARAIQAAATMGIELPAEQAEHPDVLAWDAEEEEEARRHDECYTGNEEADELALLRATRLSGTKVPRSNREPPAMQPHETRSAKIRREAIQSRAKASLGAEGGIYAPGPAPPRPTIGRRAPNLGDAEARLSSVQWLKRYGLKRQGLPLRRLARDVGLGNQAAQTRPRAVAEDDWERLLREPDALSGSHWHLLVSPRDWSAHVAKLERAVQSYEDRLAWLGQGSRAAFGVVLEDNVAVALDTSGSMRWQLPLLQDYFGVLAEDQLAAHCGTFSVSAFGDGLHAWTDCLVGANGDTCAAAATWVRSLSAKGDSQVVQALQLSFANPDLEAVYLVSDGLASTGSAETLAEVAVMLAERPVKIHTISFDGQDSEGERFLRELAAMSKGRFHSFTRAAADTEDRFYHPSTGEFLDEVFMLCPDGNPAGDDVDLLQAELSKAIAVLDQARALREQAREYRAELASRSQQAKDGADGEDTRPRWGEGDKSRRRRQPSGEKQTARRARHPPTQGEGPVVQAPSTRSSDLRAHHSMLHRRQLETLQRTTQCRQPPSVGEALEGGYEHWDPAARWEPREEHDEDDDEGEGAFSGSDVEVDSDAWSLSSLGSDDDDGSDGEGNGDGAWSPSPNLSSPFGGSEHEAGDNEESTSGGDTTTAASSRAASGRRRQDGQEGLNVHMSATGLVPARRSAAARPDPDLLRAMREDRYPPHSVFVNNLPPLAQPGHLHELFQSALGIQPVSVRIPWDERTEQIRGVAYVAFASDAERDCALGLEQLVMLDRNLFISRAADGPERRGLLLGDGGGGGGQAGAAGLEDLVHVRNLHA